MPLPAINQEVMMSEIEDKTGEYLSKNFKGLNLSGNELISKEFDNCNFSDCDFSGAILDKSKFIDCNFVKCNLSLIKIEQSKFIDVMFEECKAIGIDWTKASWSNFKLNSPIRFYKCIINDSSFFGLSLEEIIIEECKAHDVDFREGNFSESNFSYTDFSNGLFNNTNLTGANFSEAINYNIDVYFNIISRAKFSRCEATRLLDSLGVELVD